MKIISFFKIKPFYAKDKKQKIAKQNPDFDKRNNEMLFDLVKCLNLPEEQK